MISRQRRHQLLLKMRSANGCLRNVSRAVFSALPHLTLPHSLQMQMHRSATPPFSILITLKPSTRHSA